MHVCNRLKLLIFFLVSLGMEGSASFPVCKKRLTPWSCQLTTGKIIDLQPLSKGPAPNFEASVTTTGFKYAWDPSKSFTCNAVPPVLSAACQIGYAMTSFDIGELTTATFNTDNTGLYVGYTAGDGVRSSRVNLICDTKEAEFSAQGETSPSHYTLTLRSKHACPKNGGGGGGGGGGGSSGKGGLSIGSIMLIVLFVTIIVYIIVGLLINHFVRHRSGADLIPNREIWVAVPGLIKDGGAFLVHKVRDRGAGGYSNI